MAARKTCSQAVVRIHPPFPKGDRIPDRNPAASLSNTQAF